MLNFKRLIEGSWFPVQSDYWTCLSLSLALWPRAAFNLKVREREMERQCGTWALWSLFSCSLLACRATIFSCFLLFLSGWSWGRKWRGHAWTAFHPNIASLLYKPSSSGPSYPLHHHRRTAPVRSDRRRLVWREEKPKQIIFIHVKCCIFFYWKRS